MRLECSYCNRVFESSDSLARKISSQPCCCIYCNCSGGKIVNDAVTTNISLQLRSDLEDEVELLREQLYTLTRQLQAERQLVASYRQELDFVHQDLAEANRELLNTYAPSPQLQLDEAKKIVQTIVESEKPKSAAKAALQHNSDRQSSLVQALGQVNQIELKNLGNETINTSKNLINKSERNLKDYYKFGERYISFRAKFMELKHRFDTRNVKAKKSIPAEALESDRHDTTSNLPTAD